jgi:hypothetical protein
LPETERVNEFISGRRDRAGPGPRYGDVRRYIQKRLLNGVDVALP